MSVNIKKVREKLQKQCIARKKNLDIRFSKARSDFNSIIEMIKKEYSVSKIVQWGSLLNREKFTEVSDIDIAIEGIESAKDYFTLLKNAEKLTNFPLDIVQLERIDPIHRESIEKKGKIIFKHGK